MKIDNFFAELKRRNVYKVAVAYAVVAWLLIQAASIILPTFEAPTWTMKVLIAALAIGFPVAIAFSWAFEITLDGIVRESEVDASKSTTHHTGRKIVGITVVLAIVAAGLLVFQLLRARSTVTSGAADVKIPQKSIAVLPFENLSDDKGAAYFADGIQDEILTKLASIADLKVISRTSTARYKSKPEDLKTVSQQLGVANVLEGSVQKAADKVRVNVQLIDARADSHLWAKTYDRDMKDVFAIQSEVAQEIADSLQAKLSPAEARTLATAPTKNPEAYDLFLKAEYFANQIYSSTAKNPAETARNAADLYERAVRADPNFALAYARLAYLKARTYWYNTDPSQQAIDAARKAAERALQLQPELAEAHLSMGYVHYWGRRDYDAALAEFDMALKSLPNGANVLTAIAFIHRRQGKMEQGLDELKRSAALSPRDNLLAREIGSTLVYMRRYAEANSAYDRPLALVPDDVETQVARATMLQTSGDLDAASRTLAMIPAGIDPDGWVSFSRCQVALVRHQPDAALAALEHAPAWLVNHWPNAREPLALLRAQALAQKGEVGPARAAFLEAQQALKGLLDNPRAQTDAQSYLALVYAGLGQKEAALESGRRATETLPYSRDDMIGGFYLAQLAMVEAQVGEKQSALNHIEQLLAIPVGHLVSKTSLRLDPVWDPLRNDPRFQELCEEQTK